MFRRQNGSNLLIVGQQDQTALGMLTSAVVSLAAQSPAARFYLVDGRRAEAPTAGPWSRLADALPQSVRLSGWRDVPAVMGELAAELERRQKETDAEAPPVYFVVNGLQRCRDLRRREDDFGFGRADEPPSPPKQFADLLRDGSGLGIHTLLWCDTYTNLQRTVDRAGMRELAMRVLFQMSVADSSNLIDNPLAGKLGVHRALFSSEEDGRLEKFRPYGLPSDEWLTWVKEQLRGRRRRSGRRDGEGHGVHLAPLPFGRYFRLWASTLARNSSTLSPAIWANASSTSKPSPLAMDALASSSASLVNQSQFVSRSARMRQASARAWSKRSRPTNRPAHCSTWAT